MLKHRLNTVEGAQFFVDSERIVERIHNYMSVLIRYKFTDVGEIKKDVIKYSISNAAHHI